MMLGIRPLDPVSAITAAPVATIRPTDTLRAAANALVTDSIGLLVVADWRGVLGVLSERDLMAAIAEHVDLDHERVIDHASTDVLKVDQDSAIVDAAEAMAAAEVRHLTVCRDDEVVGVISMRDVLAVLLAHAQLEPAF